MTDISMYAEWHKFLKITRDAIEDGTIKTEMDLTDLDIAVQYVVGIAMEHNYKKLTAKMIYHLIEAFTDVEQPSKELKKEA